MKCLPWLLLGCAALACAAPGAPTAPTPERSAVHVLNRLAYGPRPGDVRRVLEMGVPAYIEGQLRPEALPLPASLVARLDALETVRQPTGDTLAQYLAVHETVADEAPESRARRRAVLNHLANQAAEARIARALDSPRQLEEVMVDFWFNHFNVYAGKGVDRALVAGYERDAIRPYALGSFRALLGATARHPAMLYYLDNWLSSAGGATGRRRGLNENYARELMELHTLGVDGGYTQRDVTELARMLTGWTYDPRALARRDEGFRFDPRRHDGGDKQWLGLRVKGGGQDEGEYALDVLAMHPATAHHLAYQLAQYFVQDQPPPALVERLARSYLEGGGEIRGVLRTLFASAEFMAPEAVGAKFKTPYQFVLSAARAGAAPLADMEQVLGALNRLGMPLYGCPTPDGYQNTERAWLDPDALGRRIALAATLGRELDPAALQATLGPAVSERSRAAIAASPAPLRAAMLLGGPDFMQR